MLPPIDCRRFWFILIVDSVCYTNDVNTDTVNLLLILYYNNDVI